MKFLCVNAGSSSLKFQLFEMPEEKVIISGYIEKIGLEDSFWTTKVNGENFQVSYNTKYNYWVIASKNVSLALRNKEDIEFYKNENNLVWYRFSKDYKQIQTNEIFMEILNKDPMILYKKPTLIGLNNIGATCFMNSTLQCLSQTEALTNYFLKESNLKRIIRNNIALENNNDPQLSPEYLELIQKLWSKFTNQSYSPYSLRNTIEEKILDKKEINYYTSILINDFQVDKKDETTSLLL